MNSKRELQLVDECICSYVNFSNVFQFPLVLTCQILSIYISFPYLGHITTLNKDLLILMCMGMVVEIEKIIKLMVVTFSCIELSETLTL
jgi:hypothetical protein